MPSFHDSITSNAAPEEVWKFLYDPSRFPDWWARIGVVDIANDRDYTVYLDSDPDFPMPHLLGADRDEQRVTVSCLYADLRFEWRLEPSGGGTRISVDVEIPDRKAHLLDEQREVIHASLQRLAGLAAVDTAAPAPHRTS